MESVRAVVQRVSRASVEVDGVVVGAIDRGLLVLVCSMEGDTATDERWLLEKLVGLRVFPDADGKMNKSIVDIAADATGAPPGSVGVGVLVVSQFTLAADLSPGRSKGNRPSFARAATPPAARDAVDRFVASVRAAVPPTVHVASGRFGADMKVGLVNDGPVTLCLDSESLSPKPSPTLSPLSAEPSPTLSSKPKAAP